MRRGGPVVALLLAGFWTASGGLAAQPERVFLGTYTTDKLADPGPIEAVFTAAAEEAETATWAVVFTVLFDTAEYTFAGTAWGSLDEGALWGQVESETGHQTFTFSGEHRDGRFHANHSEITNAFQVPTGTMTLAEATVLRGTYRLPEDESLPEPIRALFVPQSHRESVSEATQANAWDVVFHFTFGHREYSYQGTAEGGLSEGPLAGRVENESGERIFVFRGRHEGGTYSATHSEITSGEEEATGTMVLRP